jgi:PAS domain S-box
MQAHAPETSAERDTEPADFIGSLRDVVFRTRGKTFWSYLSPAWTILTGFTVEESLGRNILDFVYPDDRPANSLRKQQLESGEIAASRHTKRLLRRDGSFVWIEVDLRVLYDGTAPFWAAWARSATSQTALHWKTPFGMSASGPRSP